MFYEGSRHKEGCSKEAWSTSPGTDLQVVMVSQLAKQGMGVGTHCLLVVDGNNYGVHDYFSGKISQRNAIKMS